MISRSLRRVEQGGHRIRSEMSHSQVFQARTHPFPLQPMKGNHPLSHSGAPFSVPLRALSAEHQAGGGLSAAERATLERWGKQERWAPSYAAEPELHLIIL